VQRQVIHGQSVANESESIQEFKCLKISASANGAAGEQNGAAGEQNGAAGEQNGAAGEQNGAAGEQNGVQPGSNFTVKKRSGSIFSVTKAVWLDCYR
jgi:hypothetical protein